MSYPDPVNMTSITDMFQYANQVTEDTFVVGLLLSAYLIPLIYLLMRGYNPWKSALTAGFIVTITAMLLRVSEILTVDRYIYLSIITVIIPLVYVYLKDTST